MITKGCEVDAHSPFLIFIRSNMDTVKPHTKYRLLLYASCEELGKVP